MASNILFFQMVSASFKQERILSSQGYSTIIGVDEVGCGCLAGPVIAAAVSLPSDIRLKDIQDSKAIPHPRRKNVLRRFVEIGVGWTIGMATVEEIDKYNIRSSSLLAMKRAIEAFPGADFALIDAWKIPGLKIPQCGIIKGDRLVKSIAAASIIAKVVRDTLMQDLDVEFPGYGFAIHKGYATRTHRSALLKLGPCSIHRKSFLKKINDKGLSLF